MCHTYFFHCPLSLLGYELCLDRIFLPLTDAPRHPARGLAHSGYSVNVCEWLGSPTLTQRHPLTCSHHPHPQSQAPPITARLPREQLRPHHLPGTQGIPGPSPSPGSGVPPSDPTTLSPHLPCQLLTPVLGHDPAHPTSSPWPIHLPQASLPQGQVHASLPSSCPPKSSWAVPISPDLCEEQDTLSPCLGGPR